MCCFPIRKEEYVLIGKEFSIDIIVYKKRYLAELISSGILKNLVNMNM